jgi:hypothetical protein
MYPMLNALISLLAALAGLAASGLVVSRALGRRRPQLVAWSVTALGLTVSSVAMVFGCLLGFGGPLFRLAELGGALLAPAFLAVGVIVLTARHFQIRFAAWLVSISFMIVAVVVLTLDPLQNGFGKGVPRPDAHYGWLPVTLVEVTQALVVLTLVVCSALAALRAGSSAAQLQPVALAALAGVLIVAGSGGYLPGAAAVPALGAGAALVGLAALHTEQGTPYYAGGSRWERSDDHAAREARLPPLR